MSKLLRMCGCGGTLDELKAEDRARKVAAEQAKTLSRWEKGALLTCFVCGRVTEASASSVSELPLGDAETEESTMSATLLRCKHCTHAVRPVACGVWVSTRWVGVPEMLREGAVTGEPRTGEVPAESSPASTDRIVAQLMHQGYRLPGESDAVAGGSGGGVRPLPATSVVSLCYDKQSRLLGMYAWSAGAPYSVPTLLSLLVRPQFRRAGHGTIMCKRFFNAAIGGRLQGGAAGGARAKKGAAAVALPIPAPFAGLMRSAIREAQQSQVYVVFGSEGEALDKTLGAFLADPAGGGLLGPSSE